MKENKLADLSMDFSVQIISDTSPSLKYTLQQLCIADYFSAFIASSVVGASKPSPIIFNAAKRIRPPARRLQYAKKHSQNAVRF